MVGVLKARTATGPDVWTPVASAPLAGISLDDVSIYLPGVYFSVGGALTGATVATETAIASLTIPAQPVAGGVVLSCSMRVDRSVATDIHLVQIRLTNTSGTVLASSIVNTGVYTHHHTEGFYYTAADTAYTFVSTLLRNSGTGTATTYADTAHNRLQGLWFGSTE